MARPSYGAQGPASQNYVQQQPPPPPPQQHQQYMPPPPQHQQPMQQYMPTPPQYHFARLPPQTPINQAQTPLPQHQYLPPTPQHRFAPPQQTPPLRVAQQDRRKVNPNVFEAEQRQRQATQFRADQRALRVHAQHRVPYQAVQPDRAQEMARNQEIAHRHQEAMMRAQPAQQRYQMDNRTLFQRHQNHQVSGSSNAHIPVIFAPEHQRAQKRPTALDHNQQAKRDRQVPPQTPAPQLGPMAHPMQYEPTQGPAIRSYELTEYFFNPSFGLACHDVRAIHRVAGHFYGAMQGKGSKHPKFASLSQDEMEKDHEVFARAAEGAER